MSVSRRRFLTGTAAAVGATALPLGISTTAYGANDQIRPFCGQQAEGGVGAGGGAVY